MKNTKTICIVEDSEVFSEWLEEDLSVFDELKVIGRATCLDQAKKLLQNQSPDIMILDLRLNEESGFELLKDLRDSPDRPVVYVLTSYSMAYLKQKCMELGADGFYDKSSDYFTLIEDVRSFQKT